ncbi:hypothetical protein COLO4_17262 [Corchorus olitorius]|uniref:Uncharacterized protein n=1 Tax=Corchorus olitorius TaxID=93759 RepID=A0A1R3JDE3_9ROSI|nr:hypothetical protein COLO4_17262 [Corchorus olitorius]
MVMFKLTLQVALSLVTVHIMGKLAASDAGSLSVSLVEKVRLLIDKLTNQPAFSELLAQYSQRGYSEGQELKALVISDLYYHLQGELEGRKMSPGPFKELSQFLIESKMVKMYENKCSVDPFSTADDVYMFDLAHIKADLGLDMWDYSEWKTSKAIADTMLCCMQKANSMLLIGSSKLASLKALITLLTVYEETSLEKMTGIGGKIPDQLNFSCIDHICRSFLDTLESLSPVPDVSENVLDFLSAQADLLLHLMRSVRNSLSLSETEQTLNLMCVLARHWRSWVKAMKDMDSQLREMSIHLLAFISRGNLRFGEASSRIAPLLCPPMLKHEIDCCKKPSFVNSKNGWFALSPLGCVSKPKISGISTTTALVIKDQATENSNHVSQTYFSDLVAIQIYRITFLLLKFLCLQAEGAAKRAEELEYVDLSRFPELPMPEILHGIQDQAIAIVTELCETNKLKQIHSETQHICLLLVQIIEMALYLELCVLQICGIRPVLGRVEDFSKGVKLLMKDYFDDDDDKDPSTPEMM